MRNRRFVMLLLALPFAAVAGVFVPAPHSAAVDPGSTVAAQVDSLAIDGQALAAWVDSLAIDDGAIAGIGLFASEKRSEFQEGYAGTLSAGIRRLVSVDIERALDRIAAGDRRSSIEVSVLEPGFASADGRSPDDPVQREFEKSFVRTEVFAFFPGEDTSPPAALALYTDPGFRKAVSPRIERIWKEGEEVCVEVRGAKLVLDPMAYCDRIDDHYEEDLSCQHTQTMRNKTDRGHQSVYFKESLKTFVHRPDGLVFHYINYSRTVGMGGIKKRFGVGQIKESEEKVVEELGRRLAADTPKPAE